MFRIRGLLKKGVIAILAIGITSMLVSYIIVDRTHKIQLNDEFTKIIANHQHTTQHLIKQRLDQLILVAEEIYLLGNWEEQTTQVVSQNLESLWPRLELTFALSSMVVKQDDVELVYGQTDLALVTELNNKTILSLRPQAQFICRPVCSLVAIVPILLDNKKATLFISSDIAPSISYIQSVLTSDLSVMVNDNNNQKAGSTIQLEQKTYTPIVSSNPELTNAALEQFSQFGTSAFSLNNNKNLLGGIQYIVDDMHFFAWLTNVENETDTFVVLFVKDVGTIVDQQRQQEINLLTIIATISLSILVIISLLSYRPIQRLTKLRHTMTFIGDKKYTQALDALGRLKTGQARDEIDSLERQFAQSIDQLIDVEEKLLHSQKRLMKMATIDVTTKLSNRNAFLEDMKRLEARFSEKQTTLLFVDLDGFKNVNDNLGHVIGDVVLEHVGVRLQPLIKKGIKIYRIGGDEFLIAIESLDYIDDLKKYCEQIVHFFDRPFFIENQSISVTASIGVVVATSDVNSHVELLKQADIAMYQAKGLGKNQYCFFNDMMMDQINLRYIINTHFSNALAEGQLSLVFQPIIDVKTGRLIKLEALSRWIHPDLGFIRPDIFIEVLEETTHIDALSEWLILKAAAKVNELDRLGLHDVVVSINVSGAQVTNIDSISTLKLGCIEANVGCERIELEITETSLISDIEKAKDWITKVNKMGFRIAIDDFGTGYSSLSYLTAFPFDCVKLDRSLLIDVEENERTRNIVSSITSMIHTLNVPVVAEGIETKSHLAVIQALGCDYVQGYYYSRPLADKDLKARLADYIKHDQWLVDAQESA